MPIPLFVIVIAILASTVVIVSSKRSKVEGTSMVVLGESFSGKTSFLYRLGLVKKDGSDSKELGKRSTDEDYIEPAVIKCKKEIKIKPSKDFGGTKKYQRAGIKASEDCDIVIYFFDGYRFSKDETYRDTIQRMLEYLYNKFIGSNRPLKNVVIIASNADTYEKEAKKERKDLFEVIKQTITGPEQAILEENFYIINATEKAEVLNVADSLFEKGLFNN